MTNSPGSRSDTSKAGKWEPERLRGKPFLAWIVAAGFFRGFLLVSLIPTSVGVALAFGETGVFHWLLFLATLGGVWFYHLGGNLLNEYYDDYSGTDRINKVRTPFSGGTHALQSGAIKPGLVFATAWAALVAGLVIFVALALRVSDLVLVFAAIGLLSPILYSVPPFWLSYHGYGEILIGLTFGPAVVLAAFFIQTKGITLEAALLGVCLGCAAAAIITINEFPDAEADADSDKKTLVVQLGPEKAFWIYAVVLIAGPAIAVLGAAAGLFPVGMLAHLLLLAWAARVALRSERNYRSLPALVLTCRNTILFLIAFWIVTLAAYLLPLAWKASA